MTEHRLNNLALKLANNDITIDLLMTEATPEEIDKIIELSKNNIIVEEIDIDIIDDILDDFVN